jgi:hypothetical protein
VSIYQPSILYRPYCLASCATYGTRISSSRIPISPKLTTLLGGPDLLAEWYRRNIRIYNHVTKLIASPDDHILVIFGARHLG